MLQASSFKSQALSFKHSALSFKSQALSFRPQALGFKLPPSLCIDIKDNLDIDISIKRASFWRLQVWSGNLQAASFNLQTRSLVLVTTLISIIISIFWQASNLGLQAWGCIIFKIPVALLVLVVAVISMIIFISNGFKLQVPAPDFKLLAATFRLQASSFQLHY